MITLPFAFDSYPRAVREESEKRNDTRAEHTYADEHDALGVNKGDRHFCTISYLLGAVKLADFPWPIGLRGARIVR